MTDEFQQSFESSDPTKRRQAILDAGRTGDRRALPYLLKIYKTDPDPVIRELALKAGRRIKSLVDTGTLPAASPPVAEPPPAQPGFVSYSDYTYDPAPVVPSAPSFAPLSAPSSAVEPAAPAAPILPMIRKGPSPREREMAKTRVDMAITHKLQGNTEKAIASLAEALRYNPDLENDGLTINLATALTGIPTAAEALDMVKQAAAVVKPARLKSSSSSPESPLVNTLLEVLIYFALIVVLWLIVVLVISRQSDATFQELTQGQSRFETNPLRGIAFMGMMVVIFISAGVSTLMTLFSNTIYWAVGIPLGGGGDWTRVVSAMIRVQIGSAVLWAVLLGLTLWLFPVPAVTASGAEMDPALERWVQGIDFMGLLFLLTGVGSLGVMAYSVGRAHEFGFVKGLVTIFGATVVQCCACVLLSLAAVPAVSNPSLR